MLFDPHRAAEMIRDEMTKVGLSRDLLFSLPTVEIICFLSLSQEARNRILNEAAIKEPAA